MPDIPRLFDQLTAAGAWIVVLQLILIVFMTLIALRFAHGIVAGALRRLFDREVTEGTAQQLSSLELERRRITLEGLIYRALRVLILVIAFLMTLQVLRLDIGPAIAGLGIIGLALSLGAQHLVRDYVAGAFVLIENQYSKGDVVEIGGETGTVEDISLRRTVLRSTDGTVHYVPHGLIQIASNLSRNWAGLSLDIPVPYDTDLAALTEAIDAAGQRLAEDKKLRAAIFEQPRVTSVDKLGEQGIVVHVSGSVAALQRFNVPGILRRLILEEAAQRKLTIGWRNATPEEAIDEPKAVKDKPASRDVEATTLATIDPGATPHT
ncbi:MAG: mechanosensitive ion channel family protein [Candidatus Limnocylindrales bacterium]